MNSKENVIAAFSEEHVQKLTGITKSQLRNWDRTGFYKPSYAEDNRRLPFSRIYSFKDIVALRVLNVLRNQNSVPLQHLRKVSEKLTHLSDDKWTAIKLYVFNKKVIWLEPDTERPQEIVSDQYVIPSVILEQVYTETEQDVKKLNLRDESEYGLINKSRFISHNEPVIAGTRITVDAIYNFYNAGYTTEQIIKEYPSLTNKDIEAALSYKNSKSAA